MPNWCSNELEVRGPEDALARFHAAHARLGDNGLTFSFRGSVPMPGVLAKIHSGGATIDGERVKVWWERGGKNVRIAERTTRFLVRRYGATNWYDWAVENWGTKWDAGGTRYDASPGLRRYQFDTAWSPPDKWAVRASALHPDLRITIRYEDPGAGFAGTLAVSGGEVLVDDCHEGEGDFGGTCDM